ncbi:MAG TPA: nucleotide disphospho-sugar-binding domain-containing protein [Solirubrobacterales bacterium]|nr:nucleotide disphospho-sugar-binding domain-containing protein [Solirubrobacterales bacterium]
MTNSVGIGDALRRRGHRVVFVVEESFAGTLEERGFEEHLIRLAPRGPEGEAPGQLWEGFFRDKGPVSRMSTTEQLARFVAPTFRALFDGARYVDDHLLDLFAELRPNAIAVDNVITFPALFSSEIPWVRIVSRNPTEMKDHHVPPPYSGLPSDSGAGWDEFWAAYREANAELHGEFSDYCQERGAPMLRSDDFMHESPWLNLYSYPEELDYRRVRPLGPHWHNLGASVRSTDPAWDVPESLAEGNEPLLYLSLGSLGSIDVELLRRLIAELADAPYRVIVAKGPRAREIDLPANMAGAEFLPQTSILPKVDLVITNGGTNTVLESLYFGKPMVLLPMFWDQHDNAQRLYEKGFGIRLDSYRHRPEDLTGAIDRLLADSDVAERLKATATGLQRARGAEIAAEGIERVAIDG